MYVVSMLLRLLKKGGGVSVILLLFSVGCSDFFSQKPTEIQTNRILHDLNKIDILPDVERPYPARYMTEPKIAVEGDVVKVYYFTRNQPAAILADLLKKQFNFFVSINPSTNQLVVRLANRDEARAALEFLEEVDIPPIQIKVDCLISEIFADVTMDYETTADITNLFGSDATIKAFLPGASARAPTRSDNGLKTGITRKNFDFLIDILVSRGYAKLLMHPTLEVVNGTTARIETTERVPIQEKILSNGNIVETIIYTTVKDYLEVTPQVYADGTIGLTTKAGIASRTIPEGVDQAPIITTRTIDSQETRLHKGQSLVIGGIRKTERVSVIRGAPFLKDIPFLGVLFSSKDFEDRAKEVLFILTPSISSYGHDHPEVIEDVREKHAKPEYHNFLKDILGESFGSPLFFPESSESSRPEELQTQIQQAKKDAGKALLQAHRAKEDAEKAKVHAQREREDAEKAKAQAQRARIGAEKAQAQAQQTKQEAEGAKAQAQQEREGAEKAKAQAQQERKKAEKAQAQAQQEREGAEKAKAQAQQERKEAEKAQAQVQREKEEAKKAEETPAPKPPAPATEPSTGKKESQTK